MDNIKRMARNVGRSTMAAIHEYLNRNGEYPTKIIAEAESYFAFQMMGEAYAVNLFHQELKFAGIPVERIDKRGTGIYLCGNPVPIYDLPDGDVQFVFRKENDNGQQG